LRALGHALVAESGLVGRLSGTKVSPGDGS
jgi:hypothetical protein